MGALTGLQRLYRPWPDDSELRATLQQVAKNSIEDHYPPVRQAAVLLLAGGSSSEVTPALDRLLKTETNAGVRMTASSVRTHLQHQVDDAQP